MKWASASRHQPHKHGDIPPTSLESYTIGWESSPTEIPSAIELNRGDCDRCQTPGRSLRTRRLRYPVQ